jgi:hypothetical protein
MALVGGLPFLWAVSKGWVSAGSPSGPVNAYLLVGTLALKVLFYSRFGTHVLAVATARPV